MILALIGLILTSVLFVLLGREVTEAASGPPVFTHWLVPQEQVADVALAPGDEATPKSGREFAAEVGDTGVLEALDTAQETLDPSRFYAAFVDEEGRPLAGARVVVRTRPAHEIATAEELTALLDERPDLDTELFADEQGRISLPGNDPASGFRIYEAEVIVDGYAQQRYRLVDPGRRRRYRVGRPAVLSGRISERTSRLPVADVLVELIDSAGTRHTARSNDQGYYRIENIVPGQATLRVLSAEYLRVVKWLNLDSANREEQPLELRRGGRLRVRVIDIAGEVIPDLKVRLVENSVWNGLDVGELATDGNGEVEFSGLRTRGRYMIAIDDPEHGVARHLVQDMPKDPRDEDWFIEEEITLIENWTLRGRAFVASDGRSAADAWIIVESAAVPGFGGIRHRAAPVQADAEGRFEVSGLIEGLDYTAMVYHQEFALRILSDINAKSSAAESVQVDLQSRQRVFGEVRDTEGSPVPFATVSVTLADGQGILGSQFVVQADSEGRYSLDHFPPGVRVLIQAEDMQTRERSARIEKVTGTDGLGEIANLTTFNQN